MDGKGKEVSKGKPGAVVKCDFCHQCMNRDYLDKHIQKRHRPVLSCKICSYKCLVPKTLRKHWKTHKEGQTSNVAPTNTYAEPIFICEVCDYQCNKYELLLKHMKQHKEMLNPEKPKEYHQDGSVLYCNSCTYECINPKTMRKHIKNHKEGKSNITQSNRYDDHQHSNPKSSQNCRKKQTDGSEVDDNPGSAESLSCERCPTVYHNADMMDYEEQEHRTEPVLATVEIERPNQTRKTMIRSGTGVVSRDNKPYCTIYWSQGGCSSNTGHLVELHVGNNIVTSNDLL
ncbi:RE1-silencing transcription factor B-like [Branchiostoma lanceolatum]|uniref:RE1-silencing transcription factor B-like n=1 Tax=Branchiostoma lanceolatum TaxID=7740 RepID=UPI00345204C1